MRNQELPSNEVFATRLARWVGAPLNLIEELGHYLLILPLNTLLRQLDRASYWLEGTWLRAVIAHTLFPLTLIISMWFGFEATEAGASITSIATLALIPVVYGLFAAPLERLMPFSRDWLEGGNDMTVDVMMFFSNAFWNGFAKYLIQVLFLVSLVEALEPYGHELWPSELPGALQVMLFILIKDFFRYWLHRALHENVFLWRFHATHHSVKRLYWLNGIRSHPIEVIVQAILFAAPFALLQPSAEIVMVAVFMQLSIGLFQHSNIDLELGFWEYLFSIGDNHRYHHYPDKKIGDCNYGGEFIVWDILFGTFHKVKGERPSDNIGIGGSPQYPMTLTGLLIAPFLKNQRFDESVSPDRN